MAICETVDCTREARFVVTVGETETTESRGKVELYRKQSLRCNECLAKLIEDAHAHNRQFPSGDWRRFVEAESIREEV